jgi:hypothetical protein
MAKSKLPPPAPRAKRRHTEARTLGMNELFSSIKHVTLEALKPDTLIFESTKTMWKNCTLMEDLAASVAEGNRRGAPIRRTCARVQRAAAECKGALLGMMTGVTEADDRRMAARALKHYRNLKTAVGTMGEQTGSCWGSAIGVLL